MQDWKADPLWKPVKAVTSMDMLPGAARSPVRGQGGVLTLHRHHGEREFAREEGKADHLCDAIGCSGENAAKQVRLFAAETKNQTQSYVY